MVHEGLIKSLAGRQGVDPMTVELDYVQGVVLWALAGSQIEQPALVFKGGTCLRKAYLGDYRFSEDLDFSCLPAFSEDAFRQMLEQAALLTGVHGVALSPANARMARSGPSEASALEIKIPFRGPIQRAGTSSNLRFHIDTAETLVFPAVERPLLHAYPDAREVACVLPCYALEEMLAEKLRAVCGQRRFAVARDVYDIWRLRTMSWPEGSAAIDWEAVGPALEVKAAARGVELAGARSRLVGREKEFRSNWDSGVGHLVPVHASMFDEAWRTLVDVLADMGLG